MERRGETAVAFSPSTKLVPATLGQSNILTDPFPSVRKCTSAKASVELGDVPPAALNYGRKLGWRIGEQPAGEAGTCRK